MSVRTRRRRRGVMARREADHRWRRWLSIIERGPPREYVIYTRYLTIDEVRERYPVAAEKAYIVHLDTPAEP